jgi:hypothetical protein
LVKIQLKNVKNGLKGWGANIRWRDKKRKQELHLELDILEDLKEKGCISCIQSCRKTQIQVELLHILEKDEACWQQRSREQWLLQDDNNTSFSIELPMGEKGKGLCFPLRMAQIQFRGP